MRCNHYYSFFGNLASPLKTKIIEALKNEPLTVSEISLKIKEEQSKVSHALATLRSCSIVKSEPKGKNRIYSLNKETILPILKIIDKHKTINCKRGCLKN